MNLPTEYVDYMQNLLGDEFSLYLESLNHEADHGIRINRLKINSEKFLDISPFELNKIPYIDNGFIYDDKENPAKDVFYHAGLYYLQEPSAMLPANRLPIKKGDRVLDLCAAPGGKATELAGKLAGTGVLYANDISASRALALLKNLELCGAENIYVTAETPEKLADKLPLYFNKILCDVPCSGEGMFRKDSSLIKSWLEKGPQYYQEIQRNIVDSAYKMLAPGGMLMYSTCTFNVKEDEENIMYLLDKYSDLSLSEIDWYEGFTEGLLGLNKCVRVFPHKMKGEGHFLALLHKADINSNSLNNKDSIIINDTTNYESVIRTIANNSVNINKKNCNNINNKKYKSKNITRIKEGIQNNTTSCEEEVIQYKLPALKDNGFRDGLRYLRTGLMLNNSQHYAMTLSLDKYDLCLNMDYKDVRVLKYLKGETLFLNENETVDRGLVLILVNGFPLGFSKHDGNGKLKNLYNKGWRMN